MAYDNHNIFARILRGEIPCKKIYEDEYVLAFEDIAPAAPTHVLVVPKGEYTSFHDFTARASDKEIADFFRSAHKIAEQLNVQGEGYRLITNHGHNASQTVHHFHVHILGGKALGGLLP